MSVILDQISKLFLSTLILLLSQVNLLLGQCDCETATLFIGDNDDSETMISTVDWTLYNCFYIKGTLVIDQPTTWESKMVGMDPKSLIRVEATFSIINGTHIGNCGNELWQGIKTTGVGKLTLDDCIIQGANFGVELVNLQEFKCTNVDFIDDFVGITAGDPFDEDNDPITVLQDGQIYGCTFNTDGPSLPRPHIGHPYYNPEAPPYWPLNNGGVEFDRMYAAVFMRNCSGLTIGGGIGLGANMNEVYDARNGIIIFNSHTYVIKTKFHDFTGQFPSPFIHDPTINQVAIYSYRSHVNIRWNKIEEVHVGVWGIESTNLISKNEFRIFNGEGRVASTRGIHQERPQTLTIANNKIYNGHKGIWVDNGTRPFKIENNYLERSVETLNNEAIRVDGNEILGSVTAQIRDNDILIDNGNSSVGIILAYATGIIVDYNHIDFIASIGAGLNNVGIAAFTTSFCSISKNVITADSDYNNLESEDIQATNNGISVANSMSTAIHCNELENFDNDIFAIGTNNFTSVSSNYFGDANHGLEIYGPAMLGPQDSSGNQWLGEFDEWGAVVTGHDIINTAEQSVFIVDADGPPYLPDSYDPVELFFDFPGVPFACLMASPIINSTGIELSKFIRNDFEFSRFDDEMKWLAYANLYEILLQRDSLLAFYALDSFFTVKEVEALGELMQIRDNLSRIPSEQFSTKLVLETKLKLLTDDLIEIDSIITLNPMDKLDWIDLRELKCDTILDTMEVWLGLLDGEMEDFLLECDDALTDLSGVTTTNDLEEYLKETLQMRASLTIDGYLSTGDSTDISDMRELCPWLGGYALGLDHDIFAEITDSVAGHKVYPCLSSEPLVSSKDLNSNSLNQLMVSPNPANDRLSIESEPEISEIRLFDVASKLVFNGFPNQNSYTIDVENLNPGLYLLNIFRGYEVLTFKIVINR